MCIQNAAAPNYWDQETVDINIFETYSSTQTNFSAYDPESIMHYPIPAELTLNGYEIGWNRVLSETDKAFIATIYPF